METLGLGELVQRIKGTQVRWGTGVKGRGPRAVWGGRFQSITWGGVYQQKQVFHYSIHRLQRGTINTRKRRIEN